MRWLVVTLLVVALLIASLVAWVRWQPISASKVIWPMVEAIAIDDFVGITADGAVETELFAIANSGVSTQPVVDAAQHFLQQLTPSQRQRTQFAVDDKEWQRWANIHMSTRQGIGFGEMQPQQALAAFDLIRSGLSARGYQTARDIMRLEGHLAELLDNHTEYGEQRYWLTVMGTPSTSQPWGWQLDGHHLIVNFFVLGDQVVMTPTFMGSEPTVARTGRYRGTRILDEELAAGLALINSLDPQQQDTAIISRDKTGNNNRGELFQDNAVVPYQGLLLSDLTPAQSALAEALIQLYVGQMRDGHAEVKFDEVQQHWSRTRFMWVGETHPDAVFYYRIHSPVIMIEYDHQQPVALDGPQQPSREHVHTVVRTPNGNDYGKDLLRQHLAEHPHLLD